MNKRIDELKIGDHVLGTDDKPHKVTVIAPWGRSNRFLGLDGKPDGSYPNSWIVTVVDDKQQEASA